MEPTQRTHDELYLREDRSRQPKEYFKFLVKLTTQRIDAHAKHLEALDIGCAGGDFLYYFRQCFPDAVIHGMDVLPSLVDAAKAKLPGADIYLGDINSPDFPGRQKYAVIYMSGVHSIFDSCEHWVRNVSAMLAKDSIAFIFGMFNALPYDVLVKVRRAGDDGKYEAGWNSFSRATVQAAFKAHRCDATFIDWNVPIDIPFNASDPLRAWTTPLADGTNLATNATRVIHDFQCAIVTRWG
jgi:trans-aconitate methyltransferase